MKKAATMRCFLMIKLPKCRSYSLTPSCSQVGDLTQTFVFHSEEA